MRMKEENEKTQHSKNEDHGIWSHQFRSVQLLSHVQPFATLWTVAYQASLSMGFSSERGEEKAGL